MKKVLCLIDSLASGGAERQMSYLSTQLQHSGSEVTLVVFSDTDNFYIDSVKENDVKVIISTKGKNKCRRILEIIKYVRQIKPDEVISYKDGVNIAACIARIFKKFHLIVSERNTTQVLSSYEKIKFILYRFADVIVPNSYSQCDFISSHYPKLLHKTRVITNAIDTTIFWPSTERITNEPLKIVTTARVMAQKNVLNYVEAVALIKNRKIKAEFHWYGFQSHPYFDMVQSRVRELDIAEIIQFHPGEKNVAGIYRRSDIFCLPSSYEGFPNVICEAMACGLPVVCSNVCDNPRIVEDGVNGLLFNPASPADMADKIISMINESENERGRIGRINSEKIAKLCSFSTFIDNYKSVFLTE